MDILDQAQAYEDKHRATAIANARTSLQNDNNLECCLDCQEPIPEARRAAMPGCRLCVNCQTSMEKKKGGAYG